MVSVWNYKYKLSEMGEGTRLEKAWKYELKMGAFKAMLKKVKEFKLFEVESIVAASHKKYF